MLALSFKDPSRDMMLVLILASTVNVIEVMAVSPGKVRLTWLSIPDECKESKLKDESCIRSRLLRLVYLDRVTVSPSSNSSSSITIEFNHSKCFPIEQTSCADMITRQEVHFRGASTSIAMKSKAQLLHVHIIQKSPSNPGAA